MTTISRSILMVANDAGGAEVLSSYARRNPDDYIFSLDGPAINIFKNNLGKIKNMSLTSALHKCNLLICGTGWATTFEYDAIRLAKKHGVKVCAILDHWVNYKERFLRNGLEVLPDEIYVCDKHAEVQARDLFDIPIILIPNYFADEIISKIKIFSKKISRKNKLLYLCEPIKDHVVKNPKLKLLMYDEYTAFDYFIQNIDKISADIEQMTIRLHPSEDIEKFESYAKRTNITLLLSHDNPLEMDIANHNIIIGCETMALYIAARSGKKAISCIPPGGRACSLPTREVMMLRDF